jgi:hypothetical protein
MGFIEDMRWWHWMLLSVFAGLALGFINSNAGEPPPEHRSMDSPSFQENLLRAPINDHGVKKSFITNVKVYPPTTGFSGDMPTAQLVTFNCIIWSDEKDKATNDAYTLAAPIPFIALPQGAPRIGQIYPGIQAVYLGKKGDTLDSMITSVYGNLASDELRHQGRAAIIAANRQFAAARSASDMVIRPGVYYFIPWNPANQKTIVDFLDSANKSGRSIPYKLAWWTNQKYAYPIWLGGSVLTVGIIWPILLRTMLMSGFGRPEKQKALSLRHVKNVPTPGYKPQQAELTSHDLAQLKALEEQMTANLAAGPAVAHEPAPPPAPAQIRKLDGIVEAPTSAAKAEEEKTYKGVFYPVALEKKPEKENEK